MRRRRESGALLGIVLVLLLLVFAAGGFAFWGLRGDTNATGNDRLQRQLFACAEQALAIGKQQFGNFQRSAWDKFMNADVCSSGVLPCGPFPTGATGSVANYPTGSPYQGTLTVSPGPMTFQYNIGLYNNYEINGGTMYADTDNIAVVYARCLDKGTNQSRVAQAVISSKVISTGCPYRAMAGASCRGNGNQN